MHQLSTLFLSLILLLAHNCEGRSRTPQGDEYRKLPPGSIVLGNAFDAPVTSLTLLISLWLSEEKTLYREAGQMIFQLYTRKNPEQHWNFELNDLDYLNYSPFNKTNPTKILTHGWHCYWGSAFNVLMKNALLLQSDVNVIVVSWDLKSSRDYFKAKSYIPTAGSVVGFMIDLLCSRIGVSLDDVHVIGHSLGAHVAGVAGREVTTGKLPRVTGLDPAGPFFSLKDEKRISADSAKFVDIIHTAIHMEGINHQVGHADFYPNGGTPIQPGCGWDVAGFRSHRRAYWLYASSVINPGQFLALKCDDWEKYTSGKCKGNDVAEMGHHATTFARGKYFLRTSDRMPYAVGNASLF